MAVFATISSFSPDSIDSVASFSISEEQSAFDIDSSRLDSGSSSSIPSVSFDCSCDIDSVFLSDTWVSEERSLRCVSSSVRLPLSVVAVVCSFTTFSLFSLSVKRFDSSVFA